MRRADFLVIGSGIAGLSFALKAAEHGSVILVTKKQQTESATNYAQGGIAVAIDEGDSFKQHVDDTLRAGAGLCRRKAVEVMVREGPRRIAELVTDGVEFSYLYRDGKRLLALGREGGHTRDRIVHRADFTGREVERALVLLCEQHPNIEIEQHSAAVDLIVTNSSFSPLLLKGGSKGGLGRETNDEEQSFSVKHNPPYRKFPFDPALVAPEQSFSVKHNPPYPPFNRRGGEESGPFNRRGGDRRCCGAYVLTPERQIEPLLARVTLLATGGCGQVYLHTTNPPIATGDGLAMAWRAGASVANLEFMQFHPTAFYSTSTSGAHAFLISEAVRGFGGVLRTSDGTPFMQGHHPLADLAPRDIVARAIDREMKTRGEDFVFLDITARRPDEVMERFPSIYKHCLEQGLDITREWIPVVPAAHYMCGGVVTDLYGRTNINGLYAAGEVACSGVHGANRLASNSLLEAVVFSHRAAEDAIKALPDIMQPPDPPDLILPEGQSASDEEWVLVSHNRFEIRKLMWDYVGIVRSNLRLERARRRVEMMHDEIAEIARRYRLTEGVIELRNLALTASLIIKCALKRKESRGLHWTTDYPEMKEGRAKDTVVKKGL